MEAAAREQAAARERQRRLQEEAKQREEAFYRQAAGYREAAGRYREARESRRAGEGRPSAAVCANFVHELDDVWLGSRNRPGAVPEPSRNRYTAFMVQIRRILAKSGFRQKVRQKLSNYWPKSNEILTNSAKFIWQKNWQQFQRFLNKILIFDPTRTVQRSALCRSRRELSNDS